MNGQSDPKVLISTAKDFELDPASAESHGRFLCVVVGWESVPEETQDKGLTVVPMCMPKRMLASRFPQHGKYL